MSTSQHFEFLHAEGSTPIKGWVRGVPLEEQAHAQLRSCAILQQCRLSVRGSQ